MLSDDEVFEIARAHWNATSATFDDQPDHGLQDPMVQQRWTGLLARVLPAPPGTVLDVGCGTGSLSVLLAGSGYKVTGIDFSPAMLARARAKAASAGLDIFFQLGNAADPELRNRYFSIVICRHVLWALPNMATVLRRWSDLLMPEGRLVLIEGFWTTGGGLHANEVIDAMPAALEVDREITTDDRLETRAHWATPGWRSAPSTSLK